MSAEDISKSLRVSTMLPLDAKSIALTLDELKDLGTDNSKAFTYYDGMRTFCLENRIEYEWKEVQYGETGLITPGYAYPPDTQIGGINYSGLIYNFVQVSGVSGASSTVTAYIEPSVNIQLAENETLNEALYFGRADIGAGEQDVALVKETFVNQSGYNMLDAKNDGAVIKLFNLTNQTYLGHFILTSTVYSGYRVLTIVEKGTWEPLQDYNTQEVAICVLKESIYTVNLSGNIIQLLRGLTIVDTVDLSAIITTSATTITGGTLNGGTGIVTFTLSDAGTFDVDFSALLTAETTVKRDSILAPNGDAVYENIFTSIATNGSIGQGFYAADLNTDYNSTTILGFPYPAGRDFVCFQYGGDFYMAVQKSVLGSRLFITPDEVFGISFFKYTNTTDKHMSKIAYLKILGRKTELLNFSSSYFVFPISSEIGTNLPDHLETGTVNELYLINGTNEADAYPLISKIYQEKIALKKTVTVPYTLTEEDNGRILFATGGTGDITVPPLPSGFECGIVQLSSDVEDIQIVDNGSTTINKPVSKTSKIFGQYYSVYLFDNTEYAHNGAIGTTTTNDFVLMGDLEDS